MQDEKRRAPCRAEKLLNDSDMNKTYSILILPRRGTQMRRLNLSQKSLRYLVAGGAFLIAVGGWLAGDYLWMKIQKKGIKELRMEALAQREQLSVLQEQTKNIQVLLSSWKGLQERIQSSLPSQNKSSVGSHLAIGELEKSLASLQQELERLISSVPTAMPATGRITSGVGTRPSPWTGKPEFHSGLDIPKPVGTPVYATGDGVVESAGISNGNGQAVVLNHGQGIVTQFAHLSKIQVKKGDRVRKGQQIAESGNTGKSTSPHLHYEVRINGVPIDPRPNLIIKQNSPPS